MFHFSFVLEFDPVLIEFINFDQTTIAAEKRRKRKRKKIKKTNKHNKKKEKLALRTEKSEEKKI